MPQESYSYGNHEVKEAEIPPEFLSAVLGMLRQDDDRELTTLAKEYGIRFRQILEERKTDPKIAKIARKVADLEQKVTKNQNLAAEDLEKLFDLLRDSNGEIDPENTIGLQVEEIQEFLRNELEPSTRRIMDYHLQELLNNPAYVDEVAKAIEDREAQKKQSAVTALQEDAEGETTKDESSPLRNLLDFNHYKTLKLSGVAAGLLVALFVGHRYGAIDGFYAANNPNNQIGKELMSLGKTGLESNTPKENPKIKYGESVRTALSTVDGIDAKSISCKPDVDKPKQIRVEFLFDSNKPFTTKGTINDSIVGEILTALEQDFVVDKDASKAILKDNNKNLAIGLVLFVQPKQKAG